MTVSPEQQSDFINAVEQAAGAAFGHVFRVAQRAVRQGDGVATGECLVSTDGRRVFLKSLPAERMEALHCERDGLQALARAGALRVPAVLGCGTAGGCGFLLLEYLPLQPLSEAGAARMGEALARLHADVGERFGWHRDNLIGRGPQANAPGDDWPEFWRRRRLEPQLSLLRAAGGDRQVLGLGERLMDELGDRLAGHRPVASLLHGDLWTGNLAQDEQGNPVVFDPAVYRGDREADLAMTSLFGGVPASLSRSYQMAWPLPSGHEWRRDLYNLYHVLNHAVLFGGGYQHMAVRLLQRLLAERGRQ